MTSAHIIAPDLVAYGIRRGWVKPAPPMPPGYDPVKEKHNQVQREAMRRTRAKRKEQKG